MQIALNGAVSMLKISVFMLKSSAFVRHNGAFHARNKRFYAHNGGVLQPTLRRRIFPSVRSSKSLTRTILARWTETSCVKVLRCLVWLWETLTLTR